MSNYFRRLPNFDYVNRFEDAPTDGFIQVKNLFQRAKIREDIFQNLSYFDNYVIKGDARPDNVAYDFYNDETLDWVVLISNNIMNVYNEWPKTQEELDRFLLRKYGSYENLYSGIHHYETFAYRTKDNITIVQPNLNVDETFYNAPEYRVETNPDIFLPKPVPGINAEASVTIDNTKVTTVTVTKAGTAYTSAPLVTFSEPDPVITATAIATLSTVQGEREIGSVQITNSGQGYLAAPTVFFTPPTPTIAPTVTAVIGAGGTVTNVGIQSGGYGYTFIPTVTFSTPEDIIGNAAFLTESSFTTGQGLDGMYVSPDGSRLYTAHGVFEIGERKIEQYDLSTPWDITTGSYVREIELTTGITFIYTTGVEFKPDGKIMYVTGLTDTGYKVASYNLSTAWNISTATYIHSIPAGSPCGVRLQDNGKFLFLMDIDAPMVLRKYPLTIAWNISTIGSEVDYVDLTTPTGEDFFLGFTFSDDGTQLYTAGANTNKAYVFNLGSPWIVSSASLLTQLDTSSQDGTITDIYINDLKTRLFISGGDNLKIYEYNIDLTAKGHAIISSEQLAQIVIDDPGGGYINPPTITIQPPIPARSAKGYAVLDNSSVGSIVITDPGYNYRSTPSIVISSPPTPFRAEGYAKIFAGEVEQIVLTERGAGYVTPPSVYIGPPGNIYEPTVNEVYRRKGQEWKFNGYNWYKKVTSGTIYFDNTSQRYEEIPGKECCRPITNYEYELSLEDKKRKIFLLKPKYLNLIIDDIEKLMTYEKGSEQYVSRTLKRGDNPRLYE